MQKNQKRRFFLLVDESCPHLVVVVVCQGSKNFLMPIIAFVRDRGVIKVTDDKVMRPCILYNSTRSSQLPSHDHHH